ncbi:MAG: acyl--CoA ligase [Lachnospiraceae bacterium]|nr:acyl--CoA ligase [Lachnospiraceae bacterium]
MDTEKQLTGYPSIDKPWLKYYSEEAINTELPSGSAYDYLYEMNKSRHKAALEYYGNTITFKQLFKNIAAVERAFLAQGVCDGDIVTVLIPNMPEAVYIFYALSKIGAVSNMVDPRTSTEGIRDYVGETKSKIIVIIDVAISKVVNIRKQLPYVERIISVSPSESFPLALKILYRIGNRFQIIDDVMQWNVFLKAGETYEIDPITIRGVANKPVMIVHTGGTTGSPKGVVLSNLNINAIAFQSMRFPTDLQACHTWLDIMPPFIAYGIGTGLHFPLIVGMTVILIPKFDADKFDELLIKHKPNHISGVPSHWYTIINSKAMQKQTMSYLISAAVGGDTMDERLEENSNDFLKSHQCDYKITKGYGMTETNGSVCRTLNDNNPIGSVGVPFTHTVIAIFSQETGEELPYNEVGEICMYGPSVMLGYYNNVEETSRIKRFHNGHEWIHSGDLGYMTEDGNVYVLNRVKRIIIRYDGFKIFPSQIEKVLLSNDKIVSACVVGVNDLNHSQGKLPLAFVVKKDSADEHITEMELVNLCQKKVPEYAQPIDYVFKDNLPLTPIGKVDYRALEIEAETAYRL